MGLIPPVSSSQVDPIGLSHIIHMGGMHKAHLNRLICKNPVTAPCSSLFLFSFLFILRIMLLFGTCGCITMEMYVIQKVKTFRFGCFYINMVHVNRWSDD